MNPYAAAHAVACLLYRDSPAKLANKLMPGRHPTYIEEWADRFSMGFGRAVSFMDENTFRRFVDLAIKEHGAEALYRYPDPQP